jgi:hypothetical protein
MTVLRLKFNYRPHQARATVARRRFTVIVWHRRAGKTFWTLSQMLADALKSVRANWRGYYIAPTFRQAKRVAWDLIKRFCRGIPGAQFNEQELRVDLPNGARIQLLGVETYDSLRGQYADGVVIDESALVPEPAFNLVILPMLADRQGWVIVVGTPMGRQNLFYKLWQMAADMLAAGREDWHRELLTWQQTGALPIEEIEIQRRAMRPEEFAQEFECSWNAAILGAYYAAEMAAVEAEGRVMRVALDKALPVYVGLDLGYSDLMVATWAQPAGSEYRILKAAAYQYSNIPDMARAWRAEVGLPIDQVILPHDAQQHELGTGLTRTEVFASLGFATIAAPKQGVHEGIDQVRRALPHCVFDHEGTAMLREALNAYRSEYDEIRQVHRVTPLHDWSSHWADSFRYLIGGWPGSGIWGKRPRGGLGVYA